MSLTPLTSSTTPRPLSGKHAGYVIVCGVILPAVTLLIESLSHMCASALFDPIPTWWHAFAAASVPIGIGASALAVRAGARGRWLALTLGFALGVATIYAFFFLPLLPIAIPAIVFYGVGILPLTPLLALLAAIHVRRALRRAAQEHGAPTPKLWHGALIAITLLTLVDAPRSMTRIGLQYFASPDAADQARGLAWLRAGSEEEILRHCYARRGLSLDVLGAFSIWQEPIHVDQARQAYYRVTGMPFNSVAPPRSARHRTESFWDSDLGGDVVGGQVEKLSLISSRLDGSADADPAIAYLEWTLEFRNDSRVPREARAQIVLPPGATVSRVTLWIDGEEREAAFGGRGAVREAYERVVQQRRDPLLVTSVGPDRVLLQCFPVPPSGGQMKVRIGLTTPLQLPRPDQGLLVLPQLAEWNFERPDSLQQTVWIESRRPLSASHTGLKAESTPRGRFAVRGALDESSSSVVVVQREAGARFAWSEDTRGSERQIVTQVLETQAVTPPSEVVFVVDASLGMQPYIEELSESLGALPDNLTWSLILADDEPRTLDPSGLLSERWRGGTDNIPALRQAWDQLAGRPSSRIVWVHAPQPIALQSVASLRQRWERRPGSAPLLLVPVAPGPNRIAEQLDGIAGFQSLARRGGLSEDLQSLFVSWKEDATQIVRTLERTRHDGSSPLTGATTSDHLVRLWARGEIDRLAQHASTRDAAVEMAVRYQLVTPVSGAVVLETQAQYDRAGLDPVAPHDVPTVPEPETWVILTLVMVTLAGMARRRQVLAR
jgi:hypothetical protein